VTNPTNGDRNWDTTSQPPSTERPSGDHGRSESGPSREAPPETASQWGPPTPASTQQSEAATPPRWEPHQQYRPPAGPPPAESGAAWTTQQMPAPQPPTEQMPGPQQYPGATGGPPWVGGPAGPGHGGPPPKKSNKKLFAMLAAVVVLALVGAGLFFFLSGDDITYQGRDIVEPEAVLTDAESTLGRIVGERNGATNDESACYFVARNAETTDIEDRLVCGPVLFVDGDETQPYLTFPLEASAGEGDATLTVADEPDSPAPAELADPELLRRPDGASPPEGSGGLAVPQPPRAEEGIFTVVPLDGLELESTPVNARIGSPTMSIDVSAIGEPERYGQGDDARRPAEGEKFVAFEIATGPGERGPVAEFSLAVQVDEDDPIPLPEDADLSSEPAGMAISVPDDAEDVSLVVSEGSLVQRLSLITGEPDPGNVAVWQRANRGQALSFSQGVTLRASQPGFVTEDLAGTLTAQAVELTYFAGPNADRAPSGPSQALLVVDAALTLDGQVGQLDPPFWTLTLPDGTVLPAGDLNDDPSLIAIAFEVPADFTDGVLNFGGVLTAPSGLTFDSLGVFVQIPIAIPEG